MVQMRDAGAELADWGRDTKRAFSAASMQRNAIGGRNNTGRRLHLTVASEEETPPAAPLAEAPLASPPALPIRSERACSPEPARSPHPRPPPEQASGASSRCPESPRGPSHSPSE